MKSNIVLSLFKSIVPKNLNPFRTTKNNQIQQQFKKIRTTVFNESMKLQSLLKIQRFNFSEQKKGPLKQEQIPEQNLQIAITEEKVQDKEVEVIHTKGTLSILDKVPGPKNPQTGQLYVLMFTCGQCNTKQIKSFTKNAYHKGVVLARCVGCDKVHLVADNLGWFEDQPTNVQKLHEGKIKKVHDHAAINAFLKKAFSEQQELLKTQNHPAQQAKQHQSPPEEKK